MARMKTLEVGALNIKMHPHSHELYARLLHDAYRAGAVAKIRGDDWGMLGWLREADHGAEPVLYGTLYKFLNIRPDEPWLDLQTRAPVETDEGEPIPQVPDHLRPNLREVRYAFFPRHHRFFFETAGLSPGSARRLLSGVLAEPSIRDTYGPVDVEMETSLEGLERILAIPTMTRLEIVITRPNQDDVGGLEARVLARLEAQNARKVEERLTSVRGESIRPDEETRAMMAVATSNGRVTGSGYNLQEEKLVESTENHPLRERLRYDPNTEDPGRVMLQAASELLRRVLRR